MWFPAPRTVEHRPEPLPSPGPDEVRVRAIASAISHGTEMLVYRGQVPAGTSLDLPTLRGSFSFPIKYGYACVGRVIEAGDAVQAVAAGDRVFVLHPHQEELVVPASLVTRLPDGVPAERGVFLANLETAVNIALDAHPRFGEDVVIFGQGVVGLLVTAILKRLGAGSIIVVDPFAKRRELAERFGAQHTMAPSEAAPGAVRGLTGGRGADLAIEVSGNGEALSAAIESVAFQGTVVVASWYGTKEVHVPLGGSFHRGRVRLVSSQVGNIDPALQPRWDVGRRLRVALGLLESLPLEELITHRLPFERAAEAYRIVDQTPEEAVQVVLTYPGHEHSDD